MDGDVAGSLGGVGEKRGELEGGPRSALGSGSEDEGSCSHDIVMMVAVVMVVTVGKGTACGAGGAEGRGAPL